MPWDLGAYCNHGTFDWAFKQGNFGDVLDTHERATGGICEALSVSWIVSDVQGLTLKSRLSWQGEIDASRVATVAQRHASEYAKKMTVDLPNDGGKVEKLVEMGDKSMRAQSVKYLTKILGLKTFAFNDQRRDYRPKFYEVFTLLKNRSVYKQNKVIYALIGFQGRNWGHAMAYKVDANKQTKFFDPNKGEFTFRNYDNFISWFKLYQRANSLYGRITSLSTSAYYRE